jgi:DNA-binding transcriptional LysR family regulator
MQSRNPLEVNILIVIIAQEGSFIRASKKLGIAPPSLTRRVAWLERSIGVKLFDRSTRNVELTAAGRLFVQESSLSLSHAERAWDLARFQAQIDSGPYRVGYSPYTHSAFLPLLNGLSPALHPPGDEPSGIVLETANTLELVERVLRGKLHAALGVGPIGDRDLWVQRAGQEGFSVCLPRNHRLAQKAAVTVHDLNRELVFWMPRSLQPRFYAQVMRYIGSLGVPPVFKEVKGATHALDRRPRIRPRPAAWFCVGSHLLFGDCLQAAPRSLSRCRNHAVYAARSEVRKAQGDCRRPLRSITGSQT